MRQEPVKPGFLAPEVELVSFRSFKRTCETCCHPEECEGAPIELAPLPPCPRRECAV